MGEHDEVPYLPDGCDLGCKKTVIVRQLLPVTTGSAQKVLASLVCMRPEDAGIQIRTSTGSVNSLGYSTAKRGSFSQIETTVKRTDL